MVVGLSLLCITLAENNDNSAFVKRLRSYKNTCREIGWEPTCERRTWNSNNTNFDLFFLFFFAKTWTASLQFFLFVQGVYK